MSKPLPPAVPTGRDLPDDLRGTREGLFYLLARPSVQAANSEPVPQRMALPDIRKLVTSGMPSAQTAPTFAMLASRDDFDFDF